MQQELAAASVPSSAELALQVHVKPKNSAASDAQTGCQRPMITAASAMKPLPADVLVEGAGRADGEVRAAEPGEDAAEEHVPPADPVDLDADRVGGLRVLADGADAQAPAGAGTAATGPATTETYIR